MAIKAGKRRKNARYSPKKSAKLSPGRKSSGKTGDSAPPRIGELDPDEFAAICSEALGGRGWQKSFIRGTGLAQSTLSRYLKGVFPIPKHIALIAEMLQTMRAHGLSVPDSFTVETDD